MRPQLDVSVVADLDQASATLRNASRELGRFHKALIRAGISQDTADVLTYKAFDWWFDTGDTTTADVESD